MHVQYGTFALEAKPDGYLYLYGSDVTGIKLARTPNTPGSIADRNQYGYYNSAIKMWQREPLAKNDATGNIINWSVPGPKDGAPVGPNVGDVWYDHYFKTTVMMWNSAGIDATFWFRYVSLRVLSIPVACSIRGYGCAGSLLHCYSHDGYINADIIHLQLCTKQ